MSTATPLTGFSPARELPNGELFYSPLGLFEFQIEGIAEIYVRTALSDGGYMPVWDTGIGKTVLAIATAAYLFDDGLIDQVVVVCERNKRYDWRNEFEKFSALSTCLYHGQGRQKRLAKAGHPHVLITTYETGRAELMARLPVAGRRGKGKAVDGPLVATLGLRDKRTLWVFDEPTKLKNRAAEVHKAFDYLLAQLRRGPHRQRVVGLTATPMDRDYGDAYNIGRIMFPNRMPTVTEFDERFQVGQDRFFNPIYDTDKVEEFAALFQGCIGRKRKTDADVIDQFPKMVEKAVQVEMGPDEAAFADAVQELAKEFEPEKTGSSMAWDAHESLVWTVARMTAGHPASHLYAGNKLSKTIVAELGADALRAIGSAKTKELIERLRPLVKGQGAQAVVFSFFPSVIREVVRELRAAGITVAEYHGQRSDHENEDAKAQFKAGKTEVLFCSDIGARGINLENAGYVFEYESALTFSNRTQRMNRVHRITSTKPSVTCTTLVLHGTVEQNIFANTIDRNATQDVLLGDTEDGTEFISAETRRAMLQAFRRNRRLT